MDLKVLQLSKSQEILRICILTVLYLIMKENDLCTFTGILRYINSTNNFWTGSNKQTNKQTHKQTNITRWQPSPLQLTLTTFLTPTLN